MSRSSVLVLAVALLAACGPRDPGPLESERGEVIYWKAGAAAFTTANCSDEPNFVASLNAPPFQENTFLTYQVDAEGLTAQALDCGTTDPGSCAPSDSGIVFTISGHQLVYDPAALKKDISNSTCKLSVDERWTLDDAGESGELTVDIAFDLVDSESACASLESSLKAKAPNGLGFKGCTVTLKVPLTYDH